MLAVPSPAVGGSLSKNAEKQKPCWCGPQLEEIQASGRHQRLTSLWPAPETVASSERRCFGSAHMVTLSIADTSLPETLQEAPLQSRIAYDLYRLPRWSLVCLMERRSKQPVQASEE
jgi:hypothetical protein